MIKDVEFKVKNILTDVNTKEKDISVILTDDNKENISQFVVLNREYEQDENKKIHACEKEYINSSFYNILGYDRIDKAIFSNNKITLEITYKENRYNLKMDISLVELSQDIIRYLKFILKEKIEFSVEKVNV